jgi:hypothetical protein
MQTEYAFNDAFYRRGLAKLGRNGRDSMRFLALEQQAPHGCSVLACAPSLMEVADAEVARAIRIWTACMASDQWPGYPPFTAHVEAKPWQAMEMEEQMLRDQIMEAAQ